MKDVIASRKSRGRTMNGAIRERKPSTKGETAEPKTRIVIVGGGFAGVTVAQRLERLTDDSVELVLLSTENHLVFSPMLAEAVGREIAPFHVVIPGREMVRRTHWLTARATAIDHDANQVHYVTAGGEQGVIFYDHL